MASAGVVTADEPRGCTLAQVLASKATRYQGAASDIWAVGGKGTMVHYNGTTWSSITPLIGKGLYGLWGRFDL